MTQQTKRKIDTPNLTPSSNPGLSRPSREEAQAAVKTLLSWAGDDPTREGLIDTPRRVVNAFDEYFKGYAQEPEDVLNRSFNEVSGYDDMVLLKDIRFESHCEHHMAPIIGRAHVAYIPKASVVGISKLARLVDVFAKRLQIQERMTADIAQSLDRVLQPKGAAVMIEAEHGCMACRGVHKDGVSMVTKTLTGAFKTDPTMRAAFMDSVNKPS